MTMTGHSVNDVAQWCLEQPSGGLRWLELNFLDGTWNAILHEADDKFEITQVAVGEGNSPQKAILAAVTVARGLP